MTLRRVFFNLDFILILSTIVLSFIGVLFIYSSGVNSDGISTSHEYIKQIIWAGSGFILLIIAALYDYRKLKDITTLIFGLAILLLIYTRVFGSYGHGAKSWIRIGSFGIQISEFTKIAYILFLARYLEKSENEQPLKRFTIACLIMFVPALLILSQPDLGTASVYFPIFIGMCFIAGIDLRYIFAFILISALTIIIALFPMWETYILNRSSQTAILLQNKRLFLLLWITLLITTGLAFTGLMIFKRRYYYWIMYALGILTIAFPLAFVAVRVLKDYQMMRLIIFLDPQIDPRGSGWNIIQSITAIGSGGYTGQGFLLGTQSHYRFLPEQSTDFIFSILSEEWGFIGGCAVFLFYTLIFLRILSIIRKSSDLFERFIATGILAFFFFHFIVNIGMVMGIMPITGIPLLFLSYGGSSLWTAMIAIGLLLNIQLRQL